VINLENLAILYSLSPYFFRNLFSLSAMPIDHAATGPGLGDISNFVWLRKKPRGFIFGQRMIEL